MIYINAIYINTIYINTIYINTIYINTINMKFQFYIKYNLYKITILYKIQFIWNTF